MARIRTIKPEFGHHDRLSALPAEVHLFAALLLPFADDEGYFPAHPKLLHAGLCPLRELGMSVPEILGKLEQIKYIERFTGTDGREYGYIVNFLKHQRVAHATASKISPLRECESTPPENIGRTPEVGRPDLEVEVEVDLGSGSGSDDGRSLDLQVREIAELHPKVHDAFHLPNIIATAILQAIARDGRDLVWAGTKCMAERVALWPANERQFLKKPEDFFGRSEYREDPDFWDRSVSSGKQPVSAETINAVRQETRAILRRRAERTNATGVCG